MDALGPFHPQIVHTPIALLVFSALFAIAGRMADREWLRKTAMLLLVFGFLGSFAAVQSGQPAHRDPEREQGVPEDRIDAHAEFGRYTLWVAGGSLAAYALAGAPRACPAARPRPSRPSRCCSRSRQRCSSASPASAAAC